MKIENCYGALHSTVLIVLLCLVATPALAQDIQTARIGTTASREASQNPLGQETEHTASLESGELGQRQTRDEAAPNIEPLGRISNRVQNRVQNRIRNRIDRYYSPQANAASPFEVANDRARTAGRIRPR